MALKVKLGSKVYVAGRGRHVYKVIRICPDPYFVALENSKGVPYGNAAVSRLTPVDTPKARPRATGTPKKPKRILPIGGPSGSEELCAKVIRILMDDFLAHGQKLDGKLLARFVANGNHDMRVHHVAVRILVEVQKYLDEPEET